MRGLDTESRQMVLDTVAQLQERLLSRESILKWDKEEIFPEDVIRKMLSPEIGLQLLFIPEEYGGLGGGAVDCCEVTRAMARICLGIATAFFAIQLGADPLLVAGTEEQKAKWLGKIAEGEALVAYGVTEPEAGSNVAAIKTKAEPVLDDSGNRIGYRINGTKQFISTGGYADFITLLAKTPEGPTFFVVEKGTEGFEQGKGEEKHGIRASNTSPLNFTDVFVPEENLIGGVPGRGLKQSNQVFGYTRLMVAAMALGAADAALDIVMRYAQERIQFGSPLSEKQGYTHKLVIPHIVRVEAVTAYLEETARRLDSSDEDLQVEGSIAKYFATEAANRAADDAMQALGGYGYIREFEVEKIKRDVKITCIYEGTSEIQQNIISTFRWKATRKSKGAFYGDMSETMLVLARESDEDIGCKTLAACADALNRLIGIMHEKRLTRQQYLMFAMADMATWTEIGISLAEKTAAAVRENSRDAARLKLVCRLFAAEAAEKVKDGAVKILAGSGVFDEESVAGELKKIGIDGLNLAGMGSVKEMDRLADIIFKRGS